MSPLVPSPRAQLAWEAAFPNDASIPLSAAFSTPAGPLPGPLFLMTPCPLASPQKHVQAQPRPHAALDTRRLAQPRLRGLAHPRPCLQATATTGHWTQSPLCKSHLRDGRNLPNPPVTRPHRQHCRAQTQNCNTRHSAENSAFLDSQTFCLSPPGAAQVESRLILQSFYLQHWETQTPSSGSSRNRPRGSHSCRSQTPTADNQAQKMRVVAF